MANPIRITKDHARFSQMEERLAKVSQAEPPLKGGGGGGTSGGMDPWQTSVETRLGQLHSDVSGLRADLGSNFRWLLGAYGAGIVIVVSALVAAYLLLADKIDAITS